MCSAYKQTETIAKETDYDINTLRFMISAHSAWGKRNNTPANTTPILEPKHNQISHLVSNRDKQDESFKTTIKKTIEALRPFLPGDLRMDVDWAINVACINNSNAYSLTVDQNNYGIGIFPFLSLFNHSCYPNCVWTAHAGHVSIRNIAPLAKGEQLTVNYIDLYKTTEERRADLRKTKHFECMCIRFVEKGSKRDRDR